MTGSTPINLNSTQTKKKNKTGAFIRKGEAVSREKT